MNTFLSLDQGYWKISLEEIIFSNFIGLLLCMHV